jgi:hypothetical protein
LGSVGAAAVGYYDLIGSVQCRQSERQGAGCIQGGDNHCQQGLPLL